MDANTAVLTTLVLYNLVLIVIGGFAARRTKNADEFFLGGRQLGPLVASISASASSSSAWTLLGVSGAAYLWGLSAIWLFPACVGGFLLNWYLLAPALQRASHQSGALTVTELLAGPPGRPYRRAIVWLASVVILISLATYVASQFQGAGKMFHETFGWSMSNSILIGGVIVVAYTLLGGFWAVSLTDTLQGLMMALTAVLLPAAALAKIGGPLALLDQLGNVPVAGFSSLFRNLPTVGGVGFVIGLLSIGLGYPGQPHVVNRIMALRAGPNSVVTARRIAITWAVLVYSGMIILGLAGRVLVGNLGDNEVIFISATHQLFSPVVAGIMLAAVLSAIMSTADSQLLLAASSVTHDLGLGSEKNMVLRSRIVILLLSAAALVTAAYGSPKIFSKVLFAWSAMGSAFGPLLLMTVLRGPVSSTYSLLAMGSGFFLSVLAYSFDATKGGVVERLLPFVVALIFAHLGSRNTRPVDQGQ